MQINIKIKLNNFKNQRIKILKSLWGLGTGDWGLEKGN